MFCQFSVFLAIWNVCLVRSKFDEVWLILEVEKKTLEANLSHTAPFILAKVV